MPYTYLVIIIIIIIMCGNVLPDIYYALQVLENLRSLIDKRDTQTLRRLNFT